MSDQHIRGGQELKDCEAALHEALPGPGTRGVPEEVDIAAACSRFMSLQLKL